MAAPTYIGKGAFASGGGDISVEVPADYQAGDVLLLFVTGDNTITTPSGWTRIAIAATTNSAEIYGAVYRKTAGSSESSVTISDTGDPTTGIMHCFRGVDIDAGFTYAQESSASAASSATFPTVTTAKPNSMIVLFSAVAADTSSTSYFSSWTNANLTSVTERSDNVTSSGDGSGIGVATGIMASAGAIGESTASLGGSVYSANFVIVLAGYASQNALFFGCEF